jgi:non-canonical (house-cleaning) NTP pyrophosphatase
MSLGPQKTQLLSHRLVSRQVGRSYQLIHRIVPFNKHDNKPFPIIGVSNQPFGDAETREGAINRAKAAYEAAYSVENESMRPDFAVGLEGGLENHQFCQPIAQEQSDHQPVTPKELWCMAWIAILGSQSETCIAAKAEDDTFSSSKGECRASSWGYAKTGSFLLPPKLSELILDENMELGNADDMLFSRNNSKHGQGTVGRLTDGRIDRDDYYVHALKLALIPWIRPELYLDGRYRQ